MQQSEYARELAQLLNILETVDRRITPEHVAQRFQELLEEDASRSVKEIRVTALGKVSRIEEILRIAAEPQMIRRAIQRAGSRELAEDALQETVCAIAERKSLDPIENLSGFFYTALIREIDHQLRRQGAISAGGGCG